MRNRRIVSTLGILVVAGGCSTEPTASDSTSVDARGAYSLALSAATFAQLPACDASLDGTSAYVANPPGIFTCVRRAWIEDKCTSTSGGAVAYASATNTLFACVGGVWKEIPLPPGPQGPAGPQGSTGAPGSQGS